MKTFEELKELGLVRTDTKNPPTIGGQSCGMTKPIVYIEIEQLGIRVECSNQRTNFKNLDLCKKMIDSILEEIT